MWPKIKVLLIFICGRQSVLVVYCKVRLVMKCQRSIHGVSEHKWFLALNLLSLQYPIAVWQHEDFTKERSCHISSIPFAKYMHIDRTAFMIRGGKHLAWKWGIKLSVRSFQPMVTAPLLQGSTIFPYILPSQFFFCWLLINGIVISYKLCFDLNETVKIYNILTDSFCFFSHYDCNNGYAVSVIHYQVT